MAFARDSITREILAALSRGPLTMQEIFCITGIGEHWLREPLQDMSRTGTVASYDDAGVTRYRVVSRVAA